MDDDEVMQEAMIAQRDELALAAFYVLEHVAEQFDDPERDLMSVDEIVLRLHSEARAYMGSLDRQVVLQSLVNGDVEA